MHIYLACFDVSDDRIRYRVGKLLGSYGNRVQKSVFEVAFKRPRQLTRLAADVAALLEESDDCRFYCVCKSCQRKCIDCEGNRVAEFPSSVVL